VHRDLKPDNILMRENQNSLLYDIVIADFGLSIKEENIMNSDPCGTPGDIFSIGCIIFQLLKGSSLF
jgi:serine/threonine protein kinase